MKISLAVALLLQNSIALSIKDDGAAAAPTNATAKAAPTAAAPAFA